MLRTASKESNFYFLFLNSKSITWAQKLKQNQPKRAHAEEGCSKSMQGNEQTKKSPIEKVGDSHFALVVSVTDSYVGFAACS